MNYRNATVTGRQHRHDPCMHTRRTCARRATSRMVAAAPRADTHHTSNTADVSPMRTIGCAVLLLLCASVVAAQPVARDTIACGIASARRPAEGVADDFTRMLQLTGDVPARASL